MYIELVLNDNWIPSVTRRERIREVLRRWCEAGEANIIYSTEVKRVFVDSASGSKKYVHDVMIVRGLSYLGDEERAALEKELSEVSDFQTFIIN